MAEKRALVLGCGGVAGGAWSIAMLEEVEKHLDWPMQSADIFIGTSVGAVLATLLAQGVSVNALVRCQAGQGLQRLWNHDKDTGGALPPLPTLRLQHLNLLRLGLKGEVNALTAAMGLLPTGRADMSGFTRLIDSVVPAGNWSDHPCTWLMAVDVATGKRVALGRDIINMPMNKAVCASYAVPGWCPPVRWQGKTYLDGGIASPISADFLLGQGVAEAVVIAPMASSRLDSPRHPFSKIERSVRRYMASIVEREVAALRAEGVKVLLLEPGPTDLATFGFNLMNPRSRKQVLRTAFSTRGKTMADAMRLFY